MLAQRGWMCRTESRGRWMRHTRHRVSTAFRTVLFAPDDLASSQPWGRCCQYHDRRCQRYYVALQAVLPKPVHPQLQSLCLRHRGHLLWCQCSGRLQPMSSGAVYAHIDRLTGIEDYIQSFCCLVLHRILRNCNRCVSSTRISIFKRNF